MAGRERAAPAAQGSGGQPRPAAPEPAEAPATLARHRTGRERLAEAIEADMPSPPALPTRETFQAALASAETQHNWTGSLELQELIVRFLGEQNIASVEDFRVPRRTVHGGVRGAPQAGELSSEDMREQWSENTARRLEMHTARFWLRLFGVHAPHLFEEAVGLGVDVDLRGTPEPHDTFFFRSIEEEHNRYLELFRFTREPRHLKALDAFPLKNSTVVDGHEIQVCRGQCCMRPRPAVRSAGATTSLLSTPPSFTRLTLHEQAV